MSVKHLAKITTVTYLTIHDLNIICYSHAINYNNSPGIRAEFFYVLVLFGYLKVNEPSGVNSEIGFTENSYIPRYLGKSMSGCVLEVTRSLFINYIR